MIDLTPVLERVSRHSLPWRPEDAALVALAVLTKGRNLHVDWDRGAGERWIRIIANSEILVLVSTTAPIVFALAPGPNWLQEFEDRVEIVEAASLDTDLYMCDEGLLESVFSGATASPGLAPSSFSVMDLWYATV